MAHIMASLIVRKGKEPMIRCEICNCWIQNSKVRLIVSLIKSVLSLQSCKTAHENANRHKNNVARKLREAAQKSSRVEKEMQDRDAILHMMETGACASMSKGLSLLCLSLRHASSIADPNYVRVKTDEQEAKERMYAEIQARINEETRKFQEEEKARTLAMGKKGVLKGEFKGWNTFTFSCRPTRHCACTRCRRRTGTLQRRHSVRL